MAGWIGRPLTLALLLAALTGAVRNAATPAAAASRTGLWVVHITPGPTGTFDRAGLQRLRAAGVNGIALTIQSLGRSAQAVRTFESVRAFARGADMTLVAVLPTGKRFTSPLLWHVRVACDAGAARLRCAARAPTLARAFQMARVGDTYRSLVAFYPDGPRAVRSPGLPRSVKRHVLLIVPLYKLFNRVPWTTAVSRAEAAGAVDLGVAPQAGLEAASTRRLAALLAGKKIAAATPPPATAAEPPPKDTTPPSAPAVTLTDSTPSTVTIAWQPSTDAIGVASYTVYVDGKVVRANAASPVTLDALTCGTHYAIGVDAVDAAGNHSSISTVDGLPRPCGGGGSGGGGSPAPVANTPVPSTPPVDTTAPSPPTGLTAGGVTPTSISLTWGAASDNVQVAGYRVYLDGTQVAAIGGTSYTFSGLVCASTHTLGVAAYDAAGNLSARASVSTQTLACTGDTTAPSMPTGLSTSAAGLTSVTLSWTSSNDNVGVTGYRLYRNGVQVGISVGTNFLFSGLSCGSTYTLGVAAVDAAGNVSGAATVGTATTACPSAGGAGVSAANVYVSTSGSDASCVRGDSSKPCLSLSRAYSLAQAGDTIAVACGSYGSQSVPARSLGTSVVTIRKDPADTRCTYVTLTGGLSINASYVVVDGFSAINNSTISMNPPNGTSCTLSYITIQNFQASGVAGGCDHITVQHGDVGTNHNACTGGPEDGIQLRGPTSTGSFGDLKPPTDMVVRDVTVHDTTGYVQCGSHVDGLQSFGCQRCTIENSRFANNDTAHIIIYQITGASSDVQDILIQNNAFGSVANPGHGLSVGGQACAVDVPTNVIVQNNTFYRGATGDVSCVGGKVAGTWRNNVMAAGAGGVCSYNLVFDYNVWSSGACGPHAKSCTPAFVDAGHTGGNVDLAPSDTCAKNVVPAVAGTYPATDIHGTARPLGAAVDAGAHESG